MKKILILAILSCLISFNSAIAGEKFHALAMYGKPLYAEGYTHFDYTNADAPKGGDLRLARTGTFDNINSLVIFGNAAAGLEYVNDRLMQRAWNEPFTLYASVAESFEIAPDRSWIIFHLNPKAKFHDGIKMTTEDVRFSFEMYKKYGHPVRRRVYSLVTDVQVISDKDIKFTFGKGFDKESALILAMMEVLPKHYWEKNDVSKTTLNIPLGSGPYKIASVEPGRKIVYERVKDYWAKDNPVNKGQYNFDNITYMYYRDDNIALQAFKSGDYDVRRETDIHKWHVNYDFNNLSSGKVLKEEIVHHRPEWTKGMIFNTRREIFSDVNVRRALGLLFDADWVNKNFYFGEFKRINSTFVNSELSGFSADDITKYDARDNQRKAITLFKRAGYLYNNQKLIKPNGDSLSFEILVNDPSDEKVVLAYSRALEKVGIEAKVRYVDSAQFMGRLDNYEYDMVLYRWINSLSPGNEQVNYWGSKSGEVKGSRNYAGVKDKAIDDLAESIAHSDSRDALVNKTKELDKKVMEGSYFIPLYYLGRDMVANDKSIKMPNNTPIYGITQETWWKEKTP